MYRVLIADDEPTAVQYVEKLIELKCPGFKVAGKAGNGREILEILEREAVDVVVSDIRMPQMDGISLVTLLRQRYPLVHSVIISGYQEFEYATGALRAGVEDYLLKPIDPSEMRTLFINIREKLDKSYYERRNRFLHHLSKGKNHVDEKELNTLFSSPVYYGAIIRRNGVISRFDTHHSRELFSMEGEQMIIYGRDDQEMLYLYPEELVVTDFRTMMEHEEKKLEDDNSYLTTVLCEKPFDTGNLPQIVEELYQTLDNTIIIGCSQTVVPGQQAGERPDESRSSLQFQRILHFIENREFSYLHDEIRNLLLIWEEEKRTQCWVEGQIRYLFYEMKRKGVLDHSDEHGLEDAFSDARSMKELCANLQEILQQSGNEEFTARKEEREIVFDDIVVYLKQHIRDKLDVRTVCQQTGVSHATLNRLFRSYVSMSYSNYLTKLRIDTAKQLMEEQPECYIKDIAECVGFQNQFYFSRVFRTMAGKSPSEYLEELHLENKETETIA